MHNNTRTTIRPIINAHTPIKFKAQVPLLQIIFTLQTCIRLLFIPAIHYDRVNFKNFKNGIILTIIMHKLLKLFIQTYTILSLQLLLHIIITDLMLSARSHDSLRHEVVYDHIPSTCTPSIAESPLVFHQRQDSQPRNLAGEVGSSAYLQQLLRQTGCLTFILTL